MEDATLLLALTGTALTNKAVVASVRTESLDELEVYGVTGALLVTGGSSGTASFELGVQGKFSTMTGPHSRNLSLPTMDTRVNFSVLTPGIVTVGSGRLTRGIVPLDFSMRIPARGTVYAIVYRSNLTAPAAFGITLHCRRVVK